MTFSFTRTREEVAKLVLGKIQQVRPTAVVSADMDTVYEAVDLRLKEMHVLGVYWRKVPRTPLSVTVTAGANSISASTDILFPIALTIADGSSDERVDIIGLRQYEAIRDKAETGLPTKALWDGEAGFTLHPVPVSSTTAKLVYEKFADDTAAATTPDVDVAMLRSLCDLVKYDLVDQFGVPADRVARWEREAMKAERRIRNLSAERVDYATVAVDESDAAPNDYVC